MAVIRCPACGKPNPEFLDQCQYCDTPLKGGAPAEATPPPGAEEPPATDPLARLRASAAEFAPEPEPDEVPAAEPTDDDVPEWLKRLRGMAAADAQPPAPTEPEPDWLWGGAAGSAADAAEPAGSPPAQAHPPEPEDVVPVASRLPEPDVPPWLRGEPEADEPPVAATEAPASDTPDWLRPEAPPEASPIAADQPPVRRRKRMTDWLAQLASRDEPAVPPAPPAPPLPAMPEPAEAHLPAAPEESAEVEPAAPDEAAPDLPLPDWLQAEPNAPEAAVAPEPPLASGQPPLEPAAEAPKPRKRMTDWLNKTDALPRVPEEAEAGPPPDLPDWLKAYTPAQAEGDLPDWLKPAGEASVPAAAEPAATPAADLPEWLQQMRPEGAELPAAPAAAERPPEATLPPAAEPEAPPLPPPPPVVPADLTEAEHLPDWLITLRQGPRPPAQPAAAEEPAAEPGDLPDWLRALSAEAPQAQAPAEEPTAEAAGAEAGVEPQPIVPPVGGVSDLDEETLAWLRSLSAGDQALAEAPAAPAEGAAEIPPESLPEWAREAQAPAEDTAAIGPEGVPTAGPASVPDLDEETLSWLSSLAQSPGESEPEPAAAGEVAGQPPAEGLPEADEPEAPEGEAAPGWLRALRGEPVEAEQPASQLPDWLRALRGLAPEEETEAEVEAALPAAELPEEPLPAEAPAPEPAPDLAQAPLPGWLAEIRPAEIEQPSPGADTYEESVGVLAGMRGVLRAEPVVALPHKAATPASKLAVSDLDAAQAQLLQGLLEEEVEPRPVPRRQTWPAVYLERWLVFLVLALAVWLAQFQAPGLFAAPTTIGADAAAAYSAVNAAPATRPALMVFDFDPGQQGELAPGAEALAAHLMQRGVPVVAVSTRPMGAGLAQWVLEGASAALDAPLTAATGAVPVRFRNLGFIPGGPVGVLRFTLDPLSWFPADFAGQAVERGPADSPEAVQSLADFGLLVLVSGTPEAARDWIEQTQVRAPELPVVAVVSAATEPLVRPYRDMPTPRLAGVVGGVVGVAQYEQQTAWAGKATGRLSGLGGGLLVAAALLALGNLVHGLLGAGLRRRRRVG